MPICVKSVSLEEYCTHIEELLEESR
jgi:hypothetical protein